MSSDLSAEVITWVSEFTRVPLRKLSPETTLFGDMGIDGDDAVELFEEFAKRFHVDLTGFQIARYFGPEGSDPFAGIFNAVHAWWIKDAHKAVGVEPITVGDLADAARLGRWHKA